MGASESTLSSSSSLRPEDQITTVSGPKIEDVDPILLKLKSLDVATPILTDVPAETSLTDLLVRKPSSSSKHGTLDPKVILDLFSMYRDWLEDKTNKIIQKQEEIENKIEVVDALAVKLLQRFNGSVSAMKTTSLHLSEVHDLKVELGDLKGRLTEVISNCDTLCRRIASDGPESLRSSIEPFSALTTDVKSSKLRPGVVGQNQPAREATEN